jgi:hypothetical protein
MTHDEMIEVIKAHRDGKVVQCRDEGEAWQDYDTHSYPPFLGTEDWRVKPPHVVGTNLLYRGCRVFVQSDQATAESFVNHVMTLSDSIGGDWLMTESPRDRRGIAGKEYELVER